jgi:predicted NBD/HSP70 family sugar kinase
LVNAIYTLDPSRVVLGGALADLYPHVEEKVLGFMREIFISGFEIPPIVMNRYGRDGAAIGAAAMILNDIFTLPDLH